MLAGLAAALAISIGVTLSPLRSTRLGKPSQGEGDTGLYRAEIRRIHAGEGYYQAAAKELVSRGYPTQSVFNWRTPLPVWALGKLPDPGLGKAILILLALALMVLGFEWTSREGEGRVGQARARRVAGPPIPLARAIQKTRARMPMLRTGGPAAATAALSHPTIGG